VLWFCYLCYLCYPFWLTSSLCCRVPSMLLHLPIGCIYILIAWLNTNFGLVTWICYASAKLLIWLQVQPLQSVTSLQITQYKLLSYHQGWLLTTRVWYSLLYHYKSTTTICDPTTKSLIQVVIPSLELTTSHWLL